MISVKEICEISKRQDSLERALFEFGVNFGLFVSKQKKKDRNSILNDARLPEIEDESGWNMASLVMYCRHPRTLCNSKSLALLYPGPFLSEIENDGTKSFFKSLPYHEEWACERVVAFAEKSWCHIKDGDENALDEVIPAIAYELINMGKENTTIKEESQRLRNGPDSPGIPFNIYDFVNAIGDSFWRGNP